jgi:hypothetical protein
VVGRLPGDIHIQRGNFTFYFPLATSLLLERRPDPHLLSRRPPSEQPLRGGSAAGACEATAMVAAAR